MPQQFPTGILVQDAAVVTDAAGQEATIRLDGDAADVSIGKLGGQAMLRLQDANRVDQTWLMGNGDLIAGGSFWCGPLLGAATRTFNFSGGSGDFNVTVSRPSPQGALLYQPLSFRAYDPTLLRATLSLGGAVAGSGISGCLRVVHISGHTGIELDAQSATVQIGGSNVGAGTLVVKNGAGLETVRLDGQRGDVVLQNADCAEDFDVEAGAEVQPGMVLVIGDAGKLQPCMTPYNRRVVGVVSGADGRRPAIVLGRTAQAAGERTPIALNGTVHCWVDADSEGIEAGDLLTTSSTPGHAMKAADYSRAFGAVLGKALAPRRSGRGLIPILVTLQ